MGANSCAFGRLTSRWCKGERSSAASVPAPESKANRGATLHGTDTPEPFLPLRDFPDIGPVGEVFPFFPRSYFLKPLRASLDDFP